MKLLWAGCLLLVLNVVAGPGEAGPPPKPAAGEASVRRFWQVLAAADFAKWAEFYADEVLVQAGSELLKPAAGLSPNGRDQDFKATRKQLIEAYERMITKGGKDGWIKAFGQIPKDQLQLVKGRENQPLAGVREGDLVLVVTLKGDDRLFYVFRPDDKGQWRVVSEKADY